jgi:hypothetical protein
MLVVFMGAAVAVYLVDKGLKSAQEPGYCPAEAVWSAFTPDFPAFVTAASQTDVARQAPELEWPLYHDVRVLFQAVTGTSLTGLRWRVFFGPKALMGQGANGRGLCVRPGVLLRVMEWGRRVFVGPRAEQGVRARGTVFYGWREGFLIVSMSREYVAAALQGAVPAFDMGPAAPRSLDISWRRPPEGALRVLAEDGLPVSGWVRGNVAARGEPLTLVGVWPSSPVLSIAGTTPSGLCSTFSWLSEALNRWPPLANGKALMSLVLDNWGCKAMPDGWDKNVAECAFALMDMDTTQALPVPELALVLRQRGPLRGTHPLKPLAPEGDTVLYEWQEHPGQVMPLAGEKLGLCLGRYERDWLATTRESLMAALIGKLRPAGPANADMTVNVNWSKLAALGKVLALRAADFELLPRMSVSDVKVQFVPLLQAVARLGELQVRFHAGGDRMVFDGFLAIQTE